MHDPVRDPVFASRGRAYVYILPWREEDLLKLGFSRDPLQRLRDLHRRFFEVFDLQRGWLLETPRVAIARRIERTFIQTWPAYRTQPPLVVPDSAAGYTEWYRGIYDAVVACARDIATTECLPFHPLRPWLADRLREHSDWLYQGATQWMEHIEDLRFNGAPASAMKYEDTLLSLLALCETVGLDLDTYLSDKVRTWYRHGSHRALFR